MSDSSDELKSDFLPDFDALVACCEQQVFRFHLASSRDVRLAGALTQKTFSRARAQKKTFRGELSPFVWMMRFALDVVPETFSDGMSKPSSWRDKARQFLVRLLKSTTHSQRPSIVDAKVLKIWDIIARLPGHLRSIFILRFVEDIEPSDISSITGLPLEKVYLNLHSAMAEVKTAVEARERGRTSELKEKRFW